jgi:hypothetical protein
LLKLWEETELYKQNKILTFFLCESLIGKLYENPMHCLIWSDFSNLPQTKGLEQKWHSCDSKIPFELVSLLQSPNDTNMCIYHSGSTGMKVSSVDWIGPGISLPSYP